MENTRVYDIVSSGPKSGKEAEYQEWYNQHVEEAFHFKGITRVLRLGCFQLPKGNFGTCPQYLTMYEFENKEAMDEFFKSPMMNPPDKKVLEKAETKFEMYWAGGYKALKTLVR
jgi:hypothetical protein